ncbi:MAG: four helix bundle protein [Anaerolinea sp.]|nr:four helix bundle protein [Anaerolinea sp.]
MDQHEFQRRTKALAIDAITMTGSLTPGRAVDIIARQLLRSATSVGANYRAACRARSPQEMFAKLSIVEEEADECLYWLEILDESHLAPSSAVQPLRGSASEILAMVVASKRTLRRRITVNRESAIGNRQSQVTRES